MDGGLMDNTVDEFAGHTPLKGLEHLGRHIRDQHGAPSGSPANFENLRGVVDPTAQVPTAEEIAAAESLIAADMLNTVQAPTPN